MSEGGHDQIHIIKGQAGTQKVLDTLEQFASYPWRGNVRAAQDGYMLPITDVLFEGANHPQPTEEFDSDGE
jgi:hypothetical protein